MRHRVHKKQFGRHTAHRLSLLRNLVTSLIEQGRITTTEPKAKELRRLAEKMVTLAKAGTLHARRQAAAVVRGPIALKKLFDELGPRFATRAGGYTRILKMYSRPGDGADLALIEYVGYEPPAKAAAPKTKKKDKEAAQAEA